MRIRTLLPMILLALATGMVAAFVVPSEAPRWLATSREATTFDVDARLVAGMVLGLELVAFLGVAIALRLAWRVLSDFLRGPRHRRGLVK